VEAATPILPPPKRLPLHDAISYVAEICKCNPDKAGRAVLAALSEGGLVASANVLVSDRSYMPGIVTGPLPVGPPRRVDAGIGPVPLDLWAGCPWPDFLRRAVVPRGNPMFRAPTPDDRCAFPVYSAPTIETADIDTWLSNNANAKVPAPAALEEKGLIGTLYEAAQLKPGAFGLAIDLKPILGLIRRYLRFGRD
jgi:hypothetical protein